MLQQKMRSIPQETLKLCRDIEIIVVTKQRAKHRKNVVTFQTYVATIMRWSQLNFVVRQYKAEGKESLS